MIDEHGQRALEMLGADDQQPVQALGSSGPDEPFRDAIRLRNLNRSSHDLDALRLENGINTVRELTIAIANQKTNGLWSVAEGPDEQ